MGPSLAPTANILSALPLWGDDVTIGSGVSTSASGGDIALSVGAGDLLGGSLTLDAGDRWKHNNIIW